VCGMDAKRIRALTECLPAPIVSKEELESERGKNVEVGVIVLGG
jgi:hypothetical protein